MDAQEAQREAAGGLRRFTAQRVQRGKMLRSVVLIALVWSALAARAAERVTVDELDQILKQQHAARASDQDEARQLAGMELTERLTELKLARIKAQFNPGEKTAEALELLADRSAFNEPPAGELPQMAPPSAAVQQEMLKAATNFATVTLKHLPDLLATRTTRNFEDVPVFAGDTSFQSGLHPVGTVVQQVSYRKGLEFASGAAASGAAQSAHGEPAPTLSSAGEFGPVLATVMTDLNEGTVRWSHWEETPDGLAGVFAYEVPKAAAHYEIDFCCTENPETYEWDSYRGKPAYHGSITVNRASGAVLRVTLQADLDSVDPPQHFALMVEFGEVEIGGKDWICPLESAVIMRSTMREEGRDWNVLHLNELRFSDYRRFGSTARIVPNAAR